MESPVFPDTAATPGLQPFFPDSSSDGTADGLGNLKEDVEDRFLSRSLVVSDCSGVVDRARNLSVLESILYGLRLSFVEKKEKLTDILALSSDTQLVGYIKEILYFLRFVSSTDDSDDVCFFALRHSLLCAPLVAISAIFDGGECLLLGDESRQEKGCDLLLTMLRLTDK